MKKAAFLLSTLVVISLIAQVASARMALSESGNPCVVKNVRTDVRPDSDGPPTPIDMAVRLVDMREVSDVKQTMMVDLGVKLQWKDPRLAKLAGCEVPLDDVWSPGIIVGNSGRLITSRPREVTIGLGGAVMYVQRYFGSIATYHNLRGFPFDKQDFVVELVSIKYGQDEIKINVAEGFTGRSEKLNISDWNIGDVWAEVRSLFLPGFQRQADSFELHIPAQRITGYYLWKVLLPLCLIVMMSWAVFWIDPARFGPQMGLSATSMLTLIAFLFATSTMLPSLGYFTTLDIFIVGSTILVFLALVEALITSFLVSKDRGKLARRMDAACRALFPLIFIAFVVTVLLYG